MKDDFLFDVVYVERKGNLIRKKNRRIEFEKDGFQLIGLGSEDFFHCSKFEPKLLRLSQAKDYINIPFNKKTENEFVMLRLTFRPEFEQYAPLLVSRFNEMIESNKEQMPRLQKKPFIPLDSQSSNVQSRRTNQAKNSSVTAMDGASELSQVKPTQLSPKSPKDQKTFEKVKFTEKMISMSDRIDVSNNKDTQKRYRSRSPNIPRKTLISPAELRKHTLESDMSEQKNIRAWSLLPGANCSKKMDFSNFDNRQKERESGSVKPSTITANRELINTGNSCFFNATMQAFASCPPLVSRCNQLYRWFQNKENFFETMEGNWLQHRILLLKGLTKMIWKLSARAEYFPDDVLSNIDARTLTVIRRYIANIHHTFDNDNQQDAHEYIITLIGDVDDLMTPKNEIFRNASKLEQEILGLNPASAFRFGIETLYICQNCRKSHLMKDFRSDLSFSVGKRASVQDLLPLFSEWTSMLKTCSQCEHPNAYACDRILTLPMCIIVNLKLYEVNGSSYTTRKKDFDLEPSFQIDVSMLESFPPRNRIQFGTPKSDVIRNKENEESSNGDGLKSDLVNGKLLSGDSAVDETTQSQDIIVDDVKEPEEPRFELLSSRKVIEDILRQLNISCDSYALNSHFERMRGYPNTDMHHKDTPLKVIKITSDGNCFYRAISWCLTGTQQYFPQLRRATAQYLKDHEDIFKKYCTKKNYSSFIADVKKKGEWSTSCEIFAMASMLNVKIMTYLQSGWRAHHPINNEKNRTGCIYLKNTHFHFEPTTTLQRSTPSTSVAKKEEIVSKNLCEKETTTNIKEAGRGSNDDENDDLLHENDEKEELLMDETENKPSQKPIEPVLYDLVAVICHLGDSPNTGHYVAYTKDISNQWTKCSDSILTKVTEAEVQKNIRNTGYILFYYRQ